MNQKFIIRLSVALALVLGTVVSAEAKKADANAYQDVKGPEMTISGIVTDPAGEPLPGASVMIKGSTTGTVTDLDGKYTLSAKQGQTLVVSYIGFKDQEFEALKAQKNVALEDDSTILDDVVVVGYGTTKRANLTGAVDQVTSKTIENRAIANLDQILTGQMPSVSIRVTDGAPYRTAYGYQIRGDYQSISNVSTTSDASTLILVDGVEYNGEDGDLSLLNPNDIESVSVLKDAAAASIYGTKAAYGVVLITTKSPQKGEKVKINYSGSVQIMTPRQLPELLTDGAAYTNFIADAYYGFNGKYGTVSYLELAKTNPRTLADEYAKYSGTTQVSGGKYMYYGNTNWYDELYKDNAFAQTHNLSVSGSTEKVNYLVSGRYYDYSGLYVGDTDTWRTYNIHAKVDVQIAPWLKIGENIEYDYGNIYMGVATSGDGLSTPESKLFTYGPTWPVYNPDGTFTKAGANVLGGLVGDAATRNRKTKISKNFRTTTNATLSFFNNTFRIKADYTYRDKNVDVQQVYVSPFYSQTPGVEETLLAAKNIYKQAVKQKNTSTTYQTVNAYAEYENTFGEKHYFKAMAGYNYQEKSLFAYEQRMRGLDYNDALPGKNAWAFAKGTYDEDSASWDYLPDTFSYGHDGNGLKKWRTAGAFFRLNYSYDNRYLLEVNGRYDGSSVYSAGNQWGFFPSVSGGWRVSQEPWWNINPKYISNLKFRASFGQLGDGLSAGAYNAESTMTSNVTESRVIDGTHIVNTLEFPDDVNSNYTWSTVQNFNVGADVTFFNNKIAVSYDYFIRRNLNMIAPGVLHSAAYGSESTMGNNADMSTYGWEANIRYDDQWMVGSHPFHLGARFAIGNNVTFIDRYTGNSEGYIANGTYREGERLGEIWGYRSNGLFQNEEQIQTAFRDSQGNPIPYSDQLHKTYTTKGVTKPGDVWLLDLNGDGKIDAGSGGDEGDATVDDHGDLEILGNIKPTCPYSFGIDLDWNGIFLSASFNGVMHQDWSPGGKHLLWNIYTNSYGSMTKWSSQNYWTEDNPNALLPRLATGNTLIKGHDNGWSTYINNTPIDRYVFNIAYLNLQNLQIGYNLPKKVLKAMHLQQFKIYFQGENLYNWSPLYNQIGRDFDVTTITYGGDDYVDGLSWWNSDGGLQYPQMRTFSFGISITY